MWLFLTEWIQVRYANMFCDIIEAKFPVGEEITIEYFPNKTHLKPGKFGQVLKLPYGLHLKTGKHSYFLDEEENPITDIDAFIDGIAAYSVGNMKKVIAMESDTRMQQGETVVDDDLSVFGQMDPNVREVLAKCPLMRYLCQKSRQTHYLTHFERLSILYVFGHLGNEGKKFVHQVMEYTLNYSYNVTQRFVNRCPEKPISCLKLRDQYKSLTAEIGCNCSFKRAKNCYPSPVLHAIALSPDIQADVTIPTSRTVTKEKTSAILDELNIHRKAQELAGKILERKKQKRVLNKEIAKIERELQSIFDNAGIDELEVEMGLLVRRKQADGSYEWLIEI